MIKLALITDAWDPQINGVVRTLKATLTHLGPGYDVQVFHPNLFRNFPIPGYSEIRASIPWGLGTKLSNYNPDSIHIATEGPLGWAAVIWCKRNNRAYTTSYHTQFPEYLQTHYHIPSGLTYLFLRWFHSKASAVMTNTPTMAKRLEAEGFKNLKMWSRGVDTNVFSAFGPGDEFMSTLPRPILLNVGRVSAEKRLEDFYSLKSSATKVQVGSGPQLEEYKAKYPDVFFLGPKSGAELAACYRSADVFVFPSRSDTFGLVMLEAMASGVPVAGYPVVGPIDIVQQGTSGYLSESLDQAVNQCLRNKLKKQDIIDHGTSFSWDKCTQQFRDNLV